MGAVHPAAGRSAGGKIYAPGSWGPNAIHQLIAPHAWRLPFERVWREKKAPVPRGTLAVKLGKYGHVRLPMFPLGGVLFPGQLLPLHIFEDRYQQMLKHCLTSGSEFGVVLIERGHEVGGGDIRSAIGTVATILDAAEAQPGHWAILTAGTRRIRIDRWHRDDPWPNADVTDITDEPPDGTETTNAADIAAHWLEVRQIFRRVCALASELGADSPTAEVSDEPGLGSFQIAALSPLGSFDQQKVLATSGVGPRLTLLVSLLAEAADLLQAALAMGDDGDD